MAESGEVNLWEYVDTTREETKPLPDLPAIPTPETVNPTKDSLAALTATERELYKMEFAIYKETSSHVKSVRQLAQKITNHILTTIDQRHLILIKSDEHPGDMLKSLKKRLAPTDRARKIELSHAYAKLQKFDKKEPIETWLQRWEKVIDECTYLNVSEINDDKPQFDFLMAIKPLDPSFSSGFEIKLNSRLAKSRELPTISYLLEQFRNHIRLEEVSKTGTINHVLATFKGQAQSGNANSGSNQSKEGNGQAEPAEVPTCFCGQVHWFSECGYVAESNRSPGWKADAEIQAKYDKKMKNPKFKQIIQRAIKRAAKD